MKCPRGGADVISISNNHYIEQTFLLFEWASKTKYEVNKEIRYLNVTEPLIGWSD